MHDQLKRPLSKTLIVIHWFSELMKKSSVYWSMALVPSSSRVSRVQERGTCGAGRSQGVLGGPDYFCPGAVSRNEQGGVKERKECFSQGQIKTQASDERIKQIT